MQVCIKATFSFDGDEKNSSGATFSTFFLLSVGKSGLPMHIFTVLTLVKIMSAVDSFRYIGKSSKLSDLLVIIFPDSCQILVFIIVFLTKYRYATYLRGCWWW